MVLPCISPICAHRPTSSTQKDPLSQQQLTGLRPDWLKRVTRDIPNADKRPSRSNTQVPQTRKVSQSQQPSKYCNKYWSFSSTLLLIQLPDRRSKSAVKNPTMKRLVVPLLLLVLFFTNDYLAKGLTYKPCNGINDLEDEGPALDDIPSVSPRRLTTLQHAAAPYSSPLRFPLSSPVASQTVRPPSFVQPAQNSLSNTADQVGQEEDCRDRYEHSRHLERI